MSREALQIEVVEAGLVTSVQDAGRFGLRALGVGTAGALDAYSHQVGNLLVGNAPQAAGLEITLDGPVLRLPRAARIALTGAEIEASVDGRSLPHWRPVRVDAGSTITLGRCRRGARAYLAIDGGLRTDPMLGSRSTDLRAGFGGHEGRAMRRGDRLELAATTLAPAPPGAASWWIDVSPELDFDLPAVLRILPGRDALEDASLAVLHRAGFRISAQSDRTGLRLEGPQLQLGEPASRSSEPVLPGTVQLPPDGQPIVLLGECGSHGGYPRIGHVIAADRARLAQLRPGETVRLAPCTLPEADAAAHAQRVRLGRLALAIESRLRS